MSHHRDRRRGARRLRHAREGAFSRHGCGQRRVFVALALAAMALAAMALPAMALGGAALAGAAPSLGDRLALVEQLLMQVGHLVRVRGGCEWAMKGGEGVRVEVRVEKGVMGGEWSYRVRAGLVTGRGRA